MFEKLVSGLPFSPALVGNLGFYARRLKKEEASRRLGLILTAMALVVQSFAVFSPPEPANAASSNDLIYGGVSTLAQVLAVYDKPGSDYKKLMDYNGVTRAEIAATQETTINSQEYGKGSSAWISWGRNSRFGTDMGEIKHNIDGSIFYSRPLWRWDTGSWTSVHGSTYNVFKGQSAKLGVFAILKDCANLAATKLLPPPPPPPAPTAVCTSLTAIKSSDTRYKFSAKATTANGATISNYTIVVKNSKDGTTKTITQPSTAGSITTAEYSFNPGAHTATLTVETSLGAKTSSACNTSFTVPQPPAPTHPAISIDKKVDGVEQKTVNTNQEFTYQIVVKNTGDVTLNQVVLTDAAPSGVTFVKASVGTITNNKWTHTLSSLTVGQSVSLTITAKVPTYKAGLIKNTVCVETPTIPATNPDDCDDAIIELPTPEIKVCDLTSYTIITIKEPLFNSTKHSKNLDDCKRIQVCDLASDTVITIREVDFNTSKHSKDLKQCDRIQVCEYATGEITTIPNNNFDEKKYSKNTFDCQTSLVSTKTASNLTQDNVDATKVVAKAGDRIQYRLTATNGGKVNASIDFKENISDTLEYATLQDNGGGTLSDVDIDGKKVKYLTWGTIQLTPGQEVTRIFTVKVLDTIPVTAQGTSDRDSYDCIMTNTFGNTVRTNVDCQTPKVLEATIEQLPSTGPGENMLFAGILASVVVYFYSRSRQLATEVRLIRKDFNSGTI